MMKQNVIVRVAVKNHEVFCFVKSRKNISHKSVQKLHGNDRSNTNNKIKIKNCTNALNMYESLESLSL